MARCVLCFTNGIPGTFKIVTEARMFVVCNSCAYSLALALNRTLSTSSTQQDDEKIYRCSETHPITCPCNGTGLDPVAPNVLCPNNCRPLINLGCAKHEKKENQITSKNSDIETITSLLKSIDKVDAISSSKVSNSLILILEAYLHAIKKHSSGFNSSHEGYAVLLEELDEAWDEIKRNDMEKTRKEMAQVGACALRFLIDVEAMK